MRKRRRRRINKKPVRKPARKPARRKTKKKQNSALLFIFLGFIFVGLFFLYRLPRQGERQQPKQKVISAPSHTSSKQTLAKAKETVPKKKPVVSPAQQVTVNKNKQEPAKAVVALKADAPAKDEKKIISDTSKEKTAQKNSISSKVTKAPIATKQVLTVQENKKQTTSNPVSKPQSKEIKIVKNNITESKKTSVSVKTAKTNTEAKKEPQPKTKKTTTAKSNIADNKKTNTVIKKIPSQPKSTEPEPQPKIVKLAKNNNTVQKKSDITVVVDSPAVEEKQQQPQPQNKQVQSAKIYSQPQKKSNISPQNKSENKDMQLAKLPVEVLPGIIKPKIKGKIAIVLDDWGYSYKYFQMIEDFKDPLTLAVLPNLPYSQRIARQADKKVFEIILHLPMEPLSKANLGLEPDTICTDMDDLTIKDILKKQISMVPYLKGMNNHMGSLATTDSRVMRIVSEELKDKNLYLLDSFTNTRSICAAAAKDCKIKFARRDIFLDNESDPEYIKARLQELKDLAQKHGSAIGIGHAKKTTLEVLKEEMPKLKKEGFKFVKVSELVR